MDLCCAGTSSGKKIRDSVVVIERSHHNDNDDDDDDFEGVKKTSASLSAVRAEIRPDLSANPIYYEFIEEFEEKYVRVLIHLVGVVSTTNDNNDNKNENDHHGGKAAPIGYRLNRFGRPRTIDKVADPYVTVSLNDSEGSTDYFNIASFTFPTLRDCQTPVWDSKCLLIGKKQAVQKHGLTLILADKNHNKARGDEVLMKIHVPGDELPPISSLSSESSTNQWKTYIKTPEETSSRTENTALEFSILMTDTQDRIVSEEDMKAVYNTNPSNRNANGGYVYKEYILGDMKEEHEDGHAVLQSWKHVNSTKAVLWILGRNDCFMHPHVAKKLFWNQGYDLYVLNYKMNGLCRPRGYVKDPHHNSHNFEGNFDTYLSDIQSSLDLMHPTTDGRQRHAEEYELLLGYAHSTGGPVLLNYLMEKGDGAFDGFIFNSPFLDWGFVGGDLIEVVLENTHFLEGLGAMNPNTKVGVATTPSGTDPVMYLGTEVVLSDWSARMWSLYYYDWGSRPLYKVPMTAGFAKGVTVVHRKLEDFKKKRRPVTIKPFLCITSRGDDVLKAEETLSRADWIGPARWEIELNDNGHDVFLSYDPSDTDMAIEMCLSWMKNRRFA